MDVQLNSIARSHGEKTGIRAGRPWRLAFAGALAALLGGTALAQTAVKPPLVYTPTSLKAEPGLPRTPQGTPDFQGVVWESQYFAGLTGIPFITPAELVITEAQSKQAHEGFVKMFASNPIAILDPEIVPLFEGLKGFPVVRGQRRSRTLVLPADGKLPLTPQAQAEVNRVNASLMGDMNKADNPEDRNVMERCIYLGGAAPLAAPNMFNPLQFVQTKTHVVIHMENGDEARIIPFAKDQGPPLGDAVAHWEGDTLVVKTTNSPANQRLRVSPLGNIIVNPDAVVVERFTRVTKDELLYQFTIIDPKVYSAPWMGEFSMFRSAGRMYGSHCHEGNYGLMNIMAGARYEERHPPPVWTNLLTEETAEPKARWTNSLKSALDQRSWAVLARKDGAGEAKVALRIERATLGMVAGVPPSLSELNVFAVDCAGQRVKMTSLTTYAARNLTGERAESPPPAAWQPAAQRPAIAEGVKQACA